MRHSRAQHLKTHLSTGKAHHLNKVKEACDLLPFIQTLLKVQMFVAVSHNKYKKMMASTLWKLGCNEEGNFKMDVLIAVINGAMTGTAAAPLWGKFAGLVGRHERHRMMI